MDLVIHVDVSRVATEKELHELLYEKLCFPEYYGRNWDAFNECISDPELVHPSRVSVSGIGTLTEKLPGVAAQLRKCASYPETIPEFEWNQ